MISPIATEKLVRDLEVFELPTVNTDQMEATDVSFDEILADVERILSPVWPIKSFLTPSRHSAAFAIAVS